MNDFYGVIVSNNDLQHHGILGMRWGIRRFQPYPKGHKGGKFLGKESRAKRKVKRAEKKLGRLEEKSRGYQESANKSFNKAIKKQSSLFGSQRAVDKHMSAATDAQRRANRLQYKGARYYNKVSKKLGKMDSSASKEMQRIGENFIKSVESSSKALYSQTLTGATVRRKR